jgi:Flp pilus assembly protein TadG
MKNLNQRFGRFKRDNRGVVAIEAALIFPLMMLLYVGLIDITGLISMNRKVTYASGVMADLVTQSKTTITKVEIEESYNAAFMVLKPMASSGVNIDVWGFRPNAGNTAFTNPWTIKNGAGCGTAPTAAGLNTLTTAGNDLIIARVCTTYTPWLAKWWSGTTSSWNGYVIGKATFAINESTAQRPRASKTLDCVTVAGGTTACS